MLIHASPEPCILLETVELLYAAVNGVPAGRLTSKDPYSIPEAEVQQMIETVSKMLELQSPELQLLFGKVKIQDGSGDMTCLARGMAYLKMDFSCPDIPSAMESLENEWRELQSREDYPVHLGKYFIDCDKSDDGRAHSLEQRIHSLSVSAEYQQRLLDVLMHFDAYTKRLKEAILPAAEYVKKSLTPWKERARPLMKHWQEQFAGAESLENIKKHWPREVARDAETVYFALRYLDAQFRVSQYDNVKKCIYLHIGVGSSSGGDSRNGLASWQLRALRLLGSAARAQILSAVRKTPMSTREIARELQMDLGTVSRDVRNLSEAGLLVAKEGEGRRRYTVCVETVEALIAYLETLKTI